MHFYIIYILFLYADCMNVPVFVLQKEVRWSRLARYPHRDV